MPPRLKRGILRKTPDALEVSDHPVTTKTKSLVKSKCVERSSFNNLQVLHLHIGLINPNKSRREKKCLSRAESLLCRLCLLVPPPHPVQY